MNNLIFKLKYIIKFVSFNYNIYILISFSKNYKIFYCKFFFRFTFLQSNQRKQYI